MTVSFIIPLYNCLPLTQAMLASLQATLPAGLSHEIIFVDDGSTDGTREWLATLPPPCQYVLNEKNLGFAGTCNRGAARARGELLFFLNNDLILQPRWFEPMLAAFARCSSVGLVGNIQRNATTGAIDHVGIRFNLKGKPEHINTLPVSSRWLGFPAYQTAAALTGACLAIRKTTWRQLGAFDEGFINGCEDIDLCLRAEQQGLKCYVALRSVVRHHISASPGRKLRDEQNTHRLVARWRAIIANKMTLAWSWQYLATHWEEPRDYPDQRVARMALFYGLHLRSRPPFSILVNVQAALDEELKRWAGLARSTPASSEPGPSGS